MFVNCPELARVKLMCEMHIIRRFPACHSLLGDWSPCDVLCIITNPHRIRLGYTRHHTTANKIGAMIPLSLFIYLGPSRGGVVHPKMGPSIWGTPWKIQTEEHEKNDTSIRRSQAEVISLMSDCCNNTQDS